MFTVNDLSNSDSAGVFDYPGTMVRIGEDAELFRAMAGYYLSDSAALLVRLREGFSRNDQAATALAAHTLIGLASNFGARRVTAEAAKIEAAARRGDPTTSMSLEPLETALDELAAALKRQLSVGDSATRPS